MIPAVYNQWHGKLDTTKKIPQSILTSLAERLSPSNAQRLRDYVLGTYVNTTRFFFATRWRMVNYFVTFMFGW